jgi:hypothetical protein
LSGVLLVVTAGGLARGTVGRAARYVSVASALGLVAAAAQVGHSGGALVYRHGAASAYTEARAGGNREGDRTGSPAVTKSEERIARGDRDER